MKDNTRSKILQYACELFKKYGYNAVSMRSIANALDISVGNLTYHFKKKEDLIEALIFEELQEYQNFFGQIYDIYDMDRYFRHLLSVQKRLTFYFDSYIQLSQISDALREKQMQMIENMNMTICRGFNELLSNGMMKAENYKGQYEDLARMLIMLTLFRFPGKELRICRNDSAETIRLMWALLANYLTEKGIEQMEESKQNVEEASLNSEDDNDLYRAYCKSDENSV